jgi:hypothetical protein
VNERRFILRTPAIRERAAEYVASLPVSEEKPLEVVIRPYRRNRTLAQNNLAHKWFAAIADAYEESHGERIAAEAFKEYLKRQLLGEQAKEIMGQLVTTTRNTSDLSVMEFRDFLDAVDRWAVENLQLFLPRGHDYEEAMGVAA